MKGNRTIAALLAMMSFAQEGLQYVADDKFHMPKKMRRGLTLQPADKKFVTIYPNTTLWWYENGELVSAVSQGQFTISDENILQDIKQGNIVIALNKKNAIRKLKNK